MCDSFTYINKYEKLKFSFYNLKPEVMLYTVKLEQTIVIVLYCD